MRLVLYFLTEERRLNHLGYLPEVSNYMAKFIKLNEIKNVKFRESYWPIAVGLRPLIAPGLYQYSYVITGEPYKELRELREKYHKGEDTFGNIGYYLYLDGQGVPKVPFALILVDWSHFSDKKLIYGGTHKKYNSNYEFELSIYDIGEFFVCNMDGYGFFWPKGYSGDEIKFILSENRIEYMLPVADIFYENGLTSLAELLNYYKMKIAFKILGEKI
jgi:hypothetical protein